MSRTQTAMRTPSSPRRIGDFGGQCLIGPCQADPQVMLRGNEVLGIPKSTSYLLGTFRAGDGTLLRCLRAVGTEPRSAALILTTAAGEQLQQDRDAASRLLCSWSTIERSGDSVTFLAGDADERPLLRFVHTPSASRWTERDVFDVEAHLVGPGLQWYHPWPDAGGCYAAAFYYRADGTFLGRDVTGFFVHEIHYLPPGFTWMETPYAVGGIEVIWQHAATEYDDGTTTYGSLAYGTDGWGFAMLYLEDGLFVGTTEFDIAVTTRASGYPESVEYDIDGERWRWTIDPHGEREPLGLPELVGAEGTWRRADDTRGIVASLGNSDWWTDGRGDSIVVAAPHHSLGNADVDALELDRR